MINHTYLTMVKNYIDIIKKDGIPVDKVIIFGSRIKDTAHKWSDIDTCIISPIFGKNRFDERLKLIKLQTIDNIIIEPHPFSPEEFNDKFDPLANEIHRTGIEI